MGRHLPQSQRGIPARGISVFSPLNLGYYALRTGSLGINLHLLLPDLKVVFPWNIALTVEGAQRRATAKPNRRSRRRHDRKDQGGHHRRPVNIRTTAVTSLFFKHYQAAHAVRGRLHISVEVPFSGVVGGGLLRLCSISNPEIVPSR